MDSEPPALGQSASFTPDLVDIGQILKDADRAGSSLDWVALRQAKQRYNIFNPTPRELLREFITDRPDKTINPITVDAGHLQIETDLVTSTFDRRQPGGASNLPPGTPASGGEGGFFGQQPFTKGDKDDHVFLLTNVRMGLLNNVDLHVFLKPFQQLKTPADGTEPAVEASGFGDMRVLMKENLWGNEGGRTAFGLTQYVDIPAGAGKLSTGAWEGGTTAAFLFRFPGKTYLGMESGIELRQDPDGQAYHAEVPASISLARGFTKELSGKVEYAAVFIGEPGVQPVGVVALALLYGLPDDWQVDLGLNVGVTAMANDWNPYIGVAKRF